MIDNVTDDNFVQKLAFLIGMPDNAKQAFNSIYLIKVYTFITFAIDPTNRKSRHSIPT